MMVGSNLKDTQLQQIVDKTIQIHDRDGDGKISFEEFCAVIGNTDVHKKMVVDVQRIEDDADVDADANAEADADADANVLIER